VDRWQRRSEICHLFPGKRSFPHLHDQRFACLALQNWHVLQRQLCPGVPSLVQDLRDFLRMGGWDRASQLATDTFFSGGPVWAHALLLLLR
jgi:hypothetical protein